MIAARTKLPAPPCTQLFGGVTERERYSAANESAKRSNAPPNDANAKVGATSESVSV